MRAISRDVSRDLTVRNFYLGLNRILHGLPLGDVSGIRDDKHVVIHIPAIERAQKIAASEPMKHHPGLCTVPVQASGYSTPGSSLMSLYWDCAQAWQGHVRTRAKPSYYL